MLCGGQKGIRSIIAPNGSGVTPVFLCFSGAHTISCGKNLPSSPDPIRATAYTICDRNHPMPNHPFGIVTENLMSQYQNSLPKDALFVKVTRTIARPITTTFKYIVPVDVTHIFPRQGDMPGNVKTTVTSQWG
jgi:hypothetical protein